MEQAHQQPWNKGRLIGQFELTETTRTTVAKWLEVSQLKGENHLFASRVSTSEHLPTRQCEKT